LASRFVGVFVAGILAELVELAALLVGGAAVATRSLHRCYG
jgi:hypothetical protein